MVMEFGDLRRGSTIEMEGVPYKVEEYYQQKMQQRAPVYHIKMRNLLTGQLIDKSFSGYGIKLTRAPVENRDCTFLYEADGVYTFMDTVSYDQYEVGRDVVGEAAGYLVDQTDCELVFYREKAIMVEMPTTVDLAVAETPAGLQGGYGLRRRQARHAGDRHPRDRPDVRRHRRSGPRRHPDRGLRHPRQRLNGRAPANRQAHRDTPMQVYTVTQLTDHLRSMLDRNPQLQDLWVGGEASNAFASAAGHRYFTLRDAGGQIRAVLFSGNPGGEHVANGAQLNVHGRVSLYAARGDVQIYVDAVMPAGAGILAAEFERLRARLEAEGLFDPSRKRPLPPFPRRIGVVTSAQGAVIHDIANVLRARYPLGELVLCPAAVQGDGAPFEIVDAIRTLGAQPAIDVIIIARGGGSAEDLSAFNTEPVARAVYASHVPIVSAVGHESDVTIADHVADLRAPAPSAAAAAVTPDAAALVREMAELHRRAHRAARHHLRRRTDEVTSTVDRMHRHLPDIPTQRQRIDDVLERARAALTATLRFRREQTASLEKALVALNPMAVLERGFAVVTTADGARTVGSAREVARGDLVRTTLRDGSFDARVL